MSTRSLNAKESMFMLCIFEDDKKNTKLLKDKINFFSINKFAQIY